MTRVRLVSPEDASPEQRGAFAHLAVTRGTVGNLWRAMAHSPELTRRLSEVGNYLRFESSLPNRLREAVILALSGRWQCAYERSVHEPIAQSLGLSPAATAALVQGGEPDELTALEAAAVRYARVLAKDGHAPASLLGPLREFGETGLVEIHALVGYYSLLALFLNGLEVEPDEPER